MAKSAQAYLNDALTKESLANHYMRIGRDSDAWRQRESAKRDRMRAFLAAELAKRNG